MFCRRDTQRVLDILGMISTKRKDHPIARMIDEANCPVATVPNVGWEGAFQSRVKEKWTDRRVVSCQRNRVKKRKTWVMTREIEVPEESEEVQESSCQCEWVNSCRLRVVHC